MVDRLTATGQICPGPPTRRDFLSVGTKVASAAIASSLFPPQLFASEEVKHRIVQVEKNTWPIVFVWLHGGPSHIDLFDPKPQAPEEVRGKWGGYEDIIPVDKRPGVYVGKWLPKTAKVLQHATLLRNIYHTEGQHKRSANLCLTGKPDHVNRDEDKDIPVGSNLLVALSKHLKAKPDSRNINDYLVFSNLPNIDPDGAVFAKDGMHVRVEYPPGKTPRGGELYASNLGTRRAPYGLVPDLERLKKRNGLRQLVNSQSNFTSPGITRSENQYKDSIDTLSLENIIEAIKAFDLNELDKSKDPSVRGLRDKFGRNAFGDHALLSYLLVQVGAKVIHINDPYWDSHFNIETELNHLVPRLDNVASTLIELLRHQAIIVFAGEFGRTPRFNNYGQGRDHYPSANFMLIAGPDEVIEPQIIGQTDKIGGTIIRGDEGFFDAVLMGPTVLRAAGYEVEDLVHGRTLEYYKNIFKSRIKTV